MRARVCLRVCLFVCRLFRSLLLLEDEVGLDQGLKEEEEEGKLCAGMCDSSRYGMQTNERACVLECVDYCEKERRNGTIPNNLVTKNSLLNDFKERTSEYFKRM